MPSEVVALLSDQALHAKENLNCCTMDGQPDKQQIKTT